MRQALLEARQALARRCNLRAVRALRREHGTWLVAVGATALWRRLLNGGATTARLPSSNCESPVAWLQHCDMRPQSRQAHGAQVVYSFYGAGS